MRLDLPGKLNHFGVAAYNQVHLSIRVETCHSRMDALTEILKSLRLEGAVFFNAEFTAPWAFRSPPSSEVAAFLRKGSRHVIIYHLVLAGRARGQVEHSTRYLDLIPGDIVVFPHGDPHIFSNGRPASIVDIGKQLKEVFSQGMSLLRDGGGGESTSFVCGYMECDRELCKNLLGGLSSVFKVNILNDHAGQWMENSIKFAAEQASANLAGSEAVLARLSEALFAETLRRYMLELPAEQTGWLAGARDPGVGAALAHLHRAPQYRWTIAGLAQHVGMSRSVLAERFRHYLGEPPMTYLSRWRLQLGARMLRSTSHSVARIAGEVGYESESAFNRAFKREFGAPPARFRTRDKSAREAVNMGRAQMAMHPSSSIQ